MLQLRFKEQIGAKVDSNPASPTMYTNLLYALASEYLCFLVYKMGK